MFLSQVFSPHLIWECLLTFNDYVFTVILCFSYYILFFFSKYSCLRCFFASSDFGMLTLNDHVLTVIWVEYLFFYLLVPASLLIVLYQNLILDLSLYIKTGLFYDRFCYKAFNINMFSCLVIFVLVTLKMHLVWPNNLIVLMLIKIYGYKSGYIKTHQS